MVELLGRSNGVGFQLHLFFQLFDVPSILAYTIAFVIVVQFWSSACCSRGSVMRAGGGMSGLSSES